MPSSDKGIFSGMKDSAGGMLDTILSIPDKPQNPTNRKVLRVMMDLALVILAVGAMLMMGGAFHPLSLLTGHFSGVFTMSALASPGIMTMMSLPMVLGAAGIGGAWLIEDCLGKEHHRTAAKVMALLTPFLMASGIALVMTSGLHHGYAASGFNNWFTLGVIALPMTAYALMRAGNVIMDHDKGIYIQRRAQQRDPSHGSHVPDPGAEFDPFEGEQQAHSILLQNLGGAGANDE